VFYILQVFVVSVVKNGLAVEFRHGELQVLV
jgi:hypothetical protein